MQTGSRALILSPAVCLRALLCCSLLPLATASCCHCCCCCCLVTCAD